MSALSDETIRELCRTVRLVVRDQGPVAVQPISVDVHLGAAALPGGPDGDEVEKVLTLWPGEFTLASVQERFYIPKNVVGFVEGKSTLAREGLQVHAAGLLDPGFYGKVTLELKNLHDTLPLELELGEAVAQVWFMWVDQPVQVPYGPGSGAHYQGQPGIMPSHRKRRRWGR